MSDRETLEARAKELKISFPANIGDKKLAAKIAEAEAERNDKTITPPAPQSGADELVVTKALTAIKYNGESYGEGDPIELDRGTYNELAASKAVAKLEDL